LAFQRAELPRRRTGEQPVSSSNFYFVNPYLFFSFKKDPFIDSVRYSDIDFGCNQSIRIRMRIKISRNFLAEGLPGEISIQKQDSTISFKRNVFMEGDEGLSKVFHCLSNILIGLQTSLYFWKRQAARRTE